MATKKIDYLGRPDGISVTSIRGDFQIPSLPNSDASTFLTTDGSGNFVLEQVSGGGGGGGTGPVRDTVSVSGNNSYVLAAGTLLEKVIYISAASVTLSVGTTSGGTELVDSMSVTGGNPEVISLDIYANGSPKTIYFTGVVGSTTIIILKNVA